MVRYLQLLAVLVNIVSLSFFFSCRVASGQRRPDHPAGRGHDHEDRGGLEEAQHAVSLPGTGLNI